MFEVNCRALQREQIVNISGGPQSPWTQNNCSHLCNCRSILSSPSGTEVKELIAKGMGELILENRVVPKSLFFFKKSHYLPFSDAERTTTRITVNVIFLPNI